MKNFDVCVIGLGYIGLPTALLCTNAGLNVSGVDNNKNKLGLLSDATMPFEEPFFETLLVEATKAGNLQLSETITNASIYIICVPTPIQSVATESDLFAPDMTFVNSVVDDLISIAEPGSLIVLESTSPVGATQNIKDTFAQKNKNVEQFDFAYCPERVIPGNIFKELQENTRIIGGLTKRATTRAMHFYKKLSEAPIVDTDATTAELTKLIENSYRDVNIAFANQVSMLCASLKINPDKAIELANHHPRVNILKPGVGVGGHCIPVDPWFLISKSKKHTSLLKEARLINNSKTEWVKSKIKKSALALEKKHGRSASIALLGLTYKEDVDDLRGSPALAVALNISSEFSNVICIDHNVSIEIDGLKIDNNFNEAVDLKVVLVNHKSNDRNDLVATKVLVF